MMLLLRLLLEHASLLKQHCSNNIKEGVSPGAFNQVMAETLNPRPSTPKP